MSEYNKGIASSVAIDEKQNIGDNRVVESSWKSGPSLLRVVSNSVKWMGHSKETLITKLLTLGGRTGFSEIRESLQLFASDKQKLFAASKVIEADFMRIVDTLESLEIVSSKLTKDCEWLHELSGKNDGNPIVRISRLLKPGLVFIEESGERIQKLSQNLSEYDERINKILRVEKILNRTFSQLAYLGTLVRIESAHLDQHLQVMFCSLVDEISQLQLSVSSLFKRKFDELKVTKSTIAKLTEQLEFQREKQSEDLSQCQLEIGKALEVMEESLRIAVEVNKKREEASVSISNCIGRAIVAMQSQDIIDQRISHIFETSQEMEARFSAITNKRNRIEIGQELRFIETSSLIMTNQIRSIRSDLGDSIDEVGTSLEEILTIDSCLQKIEIGKERGNGRSGIDDRAGSVIEALEGLRTMLSNTVSASNEAYNEVLPIRGMATDITKVILDLSQQLHLIGLNAEIQSARVGESTGLEALSSKTSAISMGTKNLCEKVSQQLDSLVGGLSGTVNGFEELYRNGDQELGELESDSDKNDVDMTRYREDLEDAANRIHGHLLGLRELILPIADKVESGSRVQGVLCVLEKNMSKLSSQAKLQADASGIDCSDANALANGLLDRYTMESEKAVHLSSIGEESEACFELAQDSVDAQVDDSMPNKESQFGDNVELF